MIINNKYNNFPSKSNICGSCSNCLKKGNCIGYLISLLEKNKATDINNSNGNEEGLKEIQDSIFNTLVLLKQDFNNITEIQNEEDIIIKDLKKKQVEMSDALNYLVGFVKKVDKMISQDNIQKEQGDEDDEDDEERERREKNKKNIAIDSSRKNSQAVGFVLNSEEEKELDTIWKEKKNFFGKKKWVQDKASEEK